MTTLSIPNGNGGGHISLPTFFRTFVEGMESEISRLKEATHEKVEAFKKARKEAVVNEEIENLLQDLKHNREFQLNFFNAANEFFEGEESKLLKEISVEEAKALSSKIRFFEEARAFLLQEDLEMSDIKLHSVVESVNTMLNTLCKLLYKIEKIADNDSPEMDQFILDQINEIEESGYKNHAVRNVEDLLELM